MWRHYFMCLLFLLFSMLGSSYAFSDEISDLVPCIIKIESGGNHMAVGSSGEIGLMQISPIVLKEHNYCLQRQNIEIDTKSGGWEVKHLFNPDLNKLIGTWYLRRLKDHYLKENYTIERLLAAYNGGITRLRKNNYDVSKMPKSTQAYIKKVLKCRRSK